MDAVTDTFKAITVRSHCDGKTIQKMKREKDEEKIEDASITSEE